MRPSRSNQGAPCPITTTPITGSKTPRPRASKEPGAEITRYPLRSKTAAFSASRLGENSTCKTVFIVNLVLQGGHRRTLRLSLCLHTCFTQDSHHRTPVRKCGLEKIQPDERGKEKPVGAYPVS